RPGERHRPRDLRRADAAGRRHRSRLRQRPTGMVRRQADRRAARTGLAPAAAPGRGAIGSRLAPVRCCWAPSDEQGGKGPMPNEAHGRLPLAGLVVIDFGQIFRGPYASLLLAKGGADVIKIEPPHGEPLRRRALPGKSATLPFAMLNQNKRAVTLNLKHKRGRALLFEMVKRADVLLENFSPGTMDDLGVGWSVLNEINPRLIYATGPGFGIR